LAKAREQEEAGEAGGSLPPPGKRAALSRADEPIRRGAGPVSAAVYRSPRGGLSRRSGSRSSPPAAAVRFRPPPASVRERPANVRETLASVRETLANVREKLANVRETLANVRETLASVREKLANVRETLANVRESLASVREKLASVRERPSAGPAP
jgi:septal ring factor EnvC (AmiA/AmiB activator)